jgi:hypothetical protein
VESEPILDRDVAQRFALAVFDILDEVTAIRLLLEGDDGEEKYKKIWNSKAEWEARNAQVAETVAQGRAVVLESMARDAEKKRHASAPRQTPSTDS